MGRSSRGGGSSGRSSSSGGSKGFSGGMNSAGRSSRSVNSRPSNTRSTSRNTYNYNNYSYRRNSNNYGYGVEPSSGMLLIIVVLIVGVFLLNLITSNGYETGKLKNYTIRKPLSISSSTETKYYTDELGWIKKPSQLEKGMKYFYKKTGVQPHLYITDNIDGEANPDNSSVEKFMSKKYDELFKDEAHLLLVYLDNEEDWGQWIMTGSVAKSVIDLEAQDFIHSIVDKYSTSDLEDEEMFSKVFSESSDILMTVYKSPWPKIILFITISGILAVIVIVVVKFRLKNKELEIEQNKQNQEILNTPLDKIKPSEDNLDDLIDKYK